MVNVDKAKQRREANQHQAIDILLEPGVDSPNAGIYRCRVCGHEIGIAKGRKLPPQTHHEHTQGAALFAGN
jgi:hypothetical protein